MLATLAVAMLVSGCAQIFKGKFADACEADVTLKKAFNEFFLSLPEPATEGPPSEEFLAEMQESFDKQVEQPLADREGKAPNEIKEEIRQAATLTRQFRESGDQSIFETEEAVKLGETIDGFLFENCKDTTAKVKATDYLFEGAPKSFKPGAVRIRLENTGNESHELAILLRNKGVTESFEEILEQQAIDKVTVVGRTGAEPAKTGYVTARLRAGSYLFVCFIPRGTVGDTEGKGVPHYVLGMKQEVKVA